MNDLWKEALYSAARLPNVYLEACTAPYCGLEQMVKVIGSRRMMFGSDGGFPAPITMLYHINAGYPLLDRDAQIDIYSVAVEGLDEYSTAAIDEIYGFLPPDANNRERNYLHAFDGVMRIRAQVYNPKLGFGLYIETGTADTPLLSQW